MAEGVKLPPTNVFSILEVQTYRSTTATSSYLRFSSQTFFSEQQPLFFVKSTLWVGFRRLVHEEKEEEEAMLP